MAHEPAKEITSDIDSLLSRLAELGYEPVGSQYSMESFGNYFVDFKSRTGSLRVVRDRLQYYISTESDDELRLAGMFQAFDDRDAFEATLLNWLTTRKAALRAVPTSVQKYSNPVEASDPCHPGRRLSALRYAEPCRETKGQ